MFSTFYKSLSLKTRKHTSNIRNSMPQHRDEIDTGKELDLKTQATDNI